eukprot:TRINITY_DN16698_c0_g1_i1.p2 TRINITY_DN16698_c0_g1~~TRINITY_DN16698_c0_g1_i1.p2  ORF type:complete len:147 (+),score=35.93 TRINITY_DN16698_c0_g1_i1:183-623(+)
MNQQQNYCFELLNDIEVKLTVAELKQKQLLLQTQDTKKQKLQQLEQKAKDCQDLKEVKELQKIKFFISNRIEKEKHKSVVVEKQIQSIIQKRKENEAKAKEFKENHENLLKNQKAKTTTYQQKFLQVEKNLEKKKITARSRTKAQG